MRFFFLLLPWLELFTLIQLGVRTSAITALAYVLLTVVIGVLLLQRQGRGLFDRLRRAQEGQSMNPQLLFDDMALGLAGLLLIIPGLITDSAALLVGLGALYRRLLRGHKEPDSGPQSPGQSGPHRPDEPDVIEGSFERLEDD